MARRKAPSRLRYEAVHPSLTVRVPAEVKAKIAEAAAAEELSISEWVQAMAAGHTADVTDIRAKTLVEGRREGDAAGYRRGRADGEAIGRSAGLVAGLLEAHLRAQKGQGIDADGLARYLVGHPEQRTIAEVLLDDRGHRDDLARLLRRAGSA